jgi:hypothetical protein
MTLAVLRNESKAPPRQSKSPVNAAAKTPSGALA